MIFDGARRPITLTRRIVQFIAFILIIYSGLLGIYIRSPLVSSGGGSESSRPEKGVVLRRGPTPRFDTYLGVRACRFARGRQLFRGCFKQAFARAITWRTLGRDFLPHLIIFLILAVLLGKFFCGWVCPLGFIQDILASFRARLGMGRLSFPGIGRRVLRKFNFVLLSFILFISLLAAFPQIPWPLRSAFSIVACLTCPAMHISSFLTGGPFRVSLGSVISIIFFSITVLFTTILMMSFFSPRLFCRFCPSGAMLTFFNKGSFLSVEKDLLRCTRCGICVDSCSLKNEEIYEEKNNKCVNFPRCIRCFRCVDSCPENRCLKIKFLHKTLFKSKFRG